MPDIKKMEGPVKFKKGLELYFDPKKDMFYDPKKKKYMSEKELLALGDVVESDHSKKKKMKESSCGTERKKMKESSCGTERKKMKEGYYSKKKKMKEDRDEEYEKFFQSALKKFGVESPAELDDEKKKEFFDYVDANWEGEDEEVEEAYHSKKKKMEEDEDFKPHMMYDPKTGKAYKAEKPEDHERMSKLGYTHEKPEKIEELNIGMNFAGNGLSVYDRDREESGDYMKIAHVQGKPNRKVQDGDDITLNIYDKKKSNHKAIIAKVEKSFPKSKIKVDDRSKMKMTQEELSLEEAIAEAKEWKVGAPVFIVISYHTNGKHSTTVLRTKEKAMKFAKDEEYHEDDVKGTAVLDMKVGKFIDKETGKYIKEENIEESRIRLSSLMNGGALLYDRDEDPDDDKLATVKVKGDPKKDIKNGDDLVLSLMDKGKSKEKEILKSLKKYYPKSKVVKEETIEEMFDLGDKVKRKDGSEEGEVVQRKIEDKSVGGRYKLKLKNGSRSKWINGNSLELVEQFSKKMQKYVDACGKDFTNWK